MRLDALNATKKPQLLTMSGSEKIKKNLQKIPCLTKIGKMVVIFF